jgi:hypothetical protein
MKILAVALLCTLSSGGTLYAQKGQPVQQLSKTAIEVGGAKLRLGMTKSQVAEKLVWHEITKINDEVWMLGTEEEMRHRELPELQFTSGLLTYADRQWTTVNNETAEALFGVVTSLNDEGLSRCSVTTDTHAETDLGLNSQRVWIICGEKTVVVARDTIGGKSFSSVSERLGHMRHSTQ